MNKNTDFSEKSPVCPNWKTPKSLADKIEQKQVAENPLKETLPSSVHRIGYLRDRDNQLRHLFDYFQRIGVPMGSETWALRALLRIIHHEADAIAVRRFVKEYEENKILDIERLSADLKHNYAMHVKRIPPIETICDYCGWPNARLIGNGMAACNDCLSEKETTEISLTNPENVVK